jgi:DNA repair ATPase RecN
MLENLTIKDFIIVDELEVNLSPGFSVLTGETGAGKSILIDALSLCLGQRSDPALVRKIKIKQILWPLLTLKKMMRLKIGCKRKNYFMMIY